MYLAPHVWFIQVDHILHIALHLGFFLLRWNSHISVPKFNLKCIIQWPLVYSEVCITITTVYFITLLWSQKEAPYLLAVTAHSSFPHTLAATNLLSVSMDLLILNINWTIKCCGPLWPAPITKHEVLKIHPCYWIYHSTFFPFYDQIIFH